MKYTMKRSSLFLVLSIFFFSCTGLKETESFVLVTGFDFTEYSDQDFLITPLEYEGEYKSIGIISATIYPEVKKAGESANYDEDKYYRRYSGNNYYLIEKTDPRDAINEMYITAKEMGADAIIKFNAKSVDLAIEKAIIPSYEVSGFAIIR